MAKLEHLINELAMEDSRAAEWLEAITEYAGTWDADWAVLEAAAKLLAFYAPKDITGQTALLVMKHQQQMGSIKYVPTI